MAAPRRDAAGVLNGSLTIIVLTPLTTCSHRPEHVSKYLFLVGVYFFVMARPATGRNSRARALRAALPCLALVPGGTCGGGADRHTDWFSTRRTSQTASPDSPLRRTAAEIHDPLTSPRLPENEQLAPPRRSGTIPKIRAASATATADTGYDSLNRRRKQPNNTRRSRSRSRSVPAVRRGRRSP